MDYSKTVIQGRGLGTRFQGMGTLLRMFSWVLLNSGCSYRVENDQHRIYSKSEYGLDKFVVAKGYHIHYVGAGEGEPVVFLIP